jgi:hypothetical protein
MFNININFNKIRVHGTREFLRPDTMWADDRYANVIILILLVT